MRALVGGNSEVSTARAKCFTHDTTVSPFIRPRFTNEFLNGLAKIARVLRQDDVERRKEAYLELEKALSQPSAMLNANALKDNMMDSKQEN